MNMAHIVAAVTSTELIDQPGARAGSFMNQVHIMMIIT
jgi:hypothetical protein